MMRVLIIGCLLLLKLNVLAQQNIVIRGKVVDARTNQGVSFAHVGICEKAVGTVSNEEGDFELKIAPFLLYDSVCISAIGFETFRQQVSDIQENGTGIVLLQPYTSVLQNVIISDDKITGRRVLEKAIARIQKNYPVKPYLLDGYYRDYLKKNNEYISFLEGVFWVEDPGFRKPDGKSKVQIKELRYSDNYMENWNKYLHKAEDDSIKVFMEGISPVFYGNEFSNMRYHNPIRNQYESVPFVGEFNSFHASNYEFEIAYYTYVEENEVYVIKFEPNPVYQYHHIKAVGEIYIRVKDFAILKFNYNFFVSKFGDEKKWYELNIEYRELEGKMFLKYLSYVNYLKIYTGPEIAEVFQYREFFVTDIKTSEFQSIKKEDMIDTSIPLHTHEVSSDDEFWNNYNVIFLEKPYKN